MTHLKNHPYKYRFAMITLLIILVVFIIAFIWGFALGREIGIIQLHKYQIEERK